MNLYASLCNNTVVMWPLFAEQIVSFCVKNNTGKIYVTRKTQGISFWLECGHPELRSRSLCIFPNSLYVFVLISMAGLSHLVNM